MKTILQSGRDAYNAKVEEGAEVTQADEGVEEAFEFVAEALKCRSRILSAA
jgi:hypothetical protein